MENYWKYINSDGTNIPPASKEFEKDGIIASSTVIFGTEDKTVHLGYYKYDNGLLHWYDQQGSIIENVNKWNYLPIDIILLMNCSSLASNYLYNYFVN